MCRRCDGCGFFRVLGEGFGVERLEGLEDLV